MQNFIFLFSILIILIPTTNAQVCVGSLGAPVVNITFGSGASNPGPQLSVAVSGASTTYNFATYATGNPPTPPNDGDYALLNTVPSLWNSWFGGVTDHTGNQNGYMAIFNASYSPQVFYAQTVTGLCAGTTYQFAAWVANLNNAAVAPSAILPNITFNILNPNTNVLLATYNTGNLIEYTSMSWNQYELLFTLPLGLSSVKLIMINNGAGGLGNDVAIDDITFRACGPTTTASTATTASSICQGDSVQLIGNVSSGLTNPVYQWQISNDNGNSFADIAGANSLNYTKTGLITGNYQFQLLSAENGNMYAASCRFVSNVVSLSVLNQVLDFNYQQNGCNSLLVQFVGNGFNAANSYWSFGDGVTSTGNTNTSHTYTSPGNYTVKYFVANTPCVDTIAKTITVLDNKAVADYYVPNIFTPNGDGINDCFGIKNWGIIKKFEFFIYNRYGEKVFYTTTPSDCWDGTFKNNKVPVGNYVYHLKATTNCGDTEKNGNVLLIR